MKHPKLAITFLSLLLLANFPLKVWAETVLEKIQRTGEMTVGVRQDAIPFGYIDNKNNWTGYSVDLTNLIYKQVQKQLNKPLKLRLEASKVENRFQIVQQGKVDLECGSTTITQQRLELVDFSIPFFMTGAQFLVKIADAPKFNIGGTLDKVPLAYIPQTTTDEIIRQIYPSADWKPVATSLEGIQKLKRGEVKAVVNDGILLYVFRSFTYS
jgi:polar amino acid transport system substrate-binding protein